MTAKQATKLATIKPSPISGTPPPKSRQFGQPNGNKRHDGSWKKEDTARYKLEQIMKLNLAQVGALANDENAPVFERNLAKALVKGDWKILESMMNQVYGAPKQRIEVEPVQPKPLIDLTEPKEDK